MTSGFSKNFAQESVSQLWAVSFLQEEMVPRVEECRVLIAAAQQELDVCDGGGGISSSGAFRDAAQMRKMEEKLPRIAAADRSMTPTTAGTMGNMQTTHGSGFGIGDPTGDRSRSMQVSHSSGFGLAEPAPEPTVALPHLRDPFELPPLPDWEAAEASRPSGWVDERLGAVASKLAALDGKWQDVDRVERGRRGELSRRLASDRERAAAREASLQADLAAALSRAEGAESELEALRLKPRFSEGKVQVEESELAALRLKLGANEGELEDLRAQLEAAEESVVAERERSSTLAENVETLGARLQHAEVAAKETEDRWSAVVEELQEQVRNLTEQAQHSGLPELEAEEAGAEAAAAALQARLDETLRQLQEKSAEAEAAAARAAAAEGSLADALARERELQEAHDLLQEEEDTMEGSREVDGEEPLREDDSTSCDPSAADLPHVAAAPELLLACFHPPGAEAPESQPSRVQVDLARAELVVELLAPVGSPRRIPLGRVGAVSHRGGGWRPAVELHLDPEVPVADAEQPAAVERLLLTADETSFDALVAAIGVPHRVAPGAAMRVLPGSVLRTPTSTLSSNATDVSDSSMHEAAGVAVAGAA